MLLCNAPRQRVAGATQAGATRTDGVALATCCQCAKHKRRQEANQIERNGLLKVRRKIFDKEGHAYFVTFSCYRRRRLLDNDRAKGIVVHFLSAQIKNQNGLCMGFVIMPDHVHAMVKFHEPGRLSTFMSQWKRRSSMQLKDLFASDLKSYGKKIDSDEPMWQPKYYCFNVYSEKMMREKLTYMHNNPVKSGLVERAEDWKFGSARWYVLNKPVGVPITRVV